MFSEETRKRYPHSHKCVPADDPFLSHLPSIRRSCSPPLIRFIIIISLLSRLYPTPPLPQPPLPQPPPSQCHSQTLYLMSWCLYSWPTMAPCQGYQHQPDPRLCTPQEMLIRACAHSQTDRQTHICIHTRILGEGDRTCICVFVYVYR